MNPCIDSSELHSGTKGERENSKVSVPSPPTSSNSETSAHNNQDDK